MQEDPPGDLVVRIIEHTRPNACVLVLCGSAGVWSLTDLQQGFTRAAATGRPLIVDLSGLVSGDEVLLGLLLTARTTHGVTLAGPITASFSQRLTRTGTDQLFGTWDTLPLALAALPT